MVCKYLDKEKRFCTLLNQKCVFFENLIGLCPENRKRQLDDLIESMDDKACFDLFLQQLVPYSFP